MSDKMIPPPLPPKFSAGSRVNTSGTSTPDSDVTVPPAPNPTTGGLEESNLNQDNVITETIRQVKVDVSNKENNPTLPAPEETVAADALARESLEQISAVPVSERNMLTSDKFADGIAEPVSGNLDQGASDVALDETFGTETVQNTPGENETGFDEILKDDEEPVPVKKTNPWPSRIIIGLACVLTIAAAVYFLVMPL